MHILQNACSGFRDNSNKATVTQQRSHVDTVAFQCVYVRKLSVWMITNNVLTSDLRNPRFCNLSRCSLRNICSYVVSKHLLGLGREEEGPPDDDTGGGRGRRQHDDNDSTTYPTPTTGDDETARRQQGRRNRTGRTVTTTTAKMRT